MSFVNELSAERINAEAELAEAKKMQNDGVDPVDIWEKTGWAPGPDGMPRTEIDDSNMTLNHDALEPGGDPVQLNEAMDHPELFEAVPELEQTTIQVADHGEQIHPDPRAMAWYDPADDHIMLTPESTDAATTLHEVGHGIQHKQGFPRDEGPPTTDEEYVEDPYEVEAFDVMDRIDGNGNDVPALVQEASDEGVGAPRSPSVGGM